MQKALWDALKKKAAQLLVPDETVVCKLCVRYSRHEGISAVATAEALTRGKAWPRLDIRNLFQGRLLRNLFQGGLSRNPFQGSRTSWPDLSLVALMWIWCDDKWFADLWQWYVAALGLEQKGFSFQQIQRWKVKSDSQEAAGQAMMWQQLSENRWQQRDWKQSRSKVEAKWLEAKWKQRDWKQCQLTRCQFGTRMLPCNPNRVKIENWTWIENQNWKQCLSTQCQSGTRMLRCNHVGWTVRPSPPQLTGQQCSSGDYTLKNILPKVVLLNFLT